VFILSLNAMDLDRPLHYSRESPCIIATLPRLHLCHGVAHCRRREIANIKERLSIIQRNRAKKSIVQPPRWWRADVAKRDGFAGVTRGGEGGNSRGRRGGGKSGEPPNSPGHACIYARLLRFLPHILNEHTATDTRSADRRTANSLIVYFLFLFYLSLSLSLAPSLSLSGERNNLSASVHFGGTPSLFREPPSLRLSLWNARGAKAELNWIFPETISVLFYSRNDNGKISR